MNYIPPTMTTDLGCAMFATVLGNMSGINCKVEFQGYSGTVILGKKGRKKRDLRFIRIKQPLWFGHREERVGGDGTAGQTPTTGFLGGMRLLGTLRMI